MILDHIIAVVPNLRATHRRLLDAGFEEAWPPGPFWPQAITSGIALGGANLELYESATAPSGPRIETLVLAPASLEEGDAFLREGALPFEVRRKVEPDPDLLALRGFPASLTATEQLICVNQLPENPPYPFFLCSYSAFLKDRLAAVQFAAPHGLIEKLLLRSPSPEDTKRLFTGSLGPISLEVELGDVCEVGEIRFTDGFILRASDL